MSGKEDKAERITLTKAHVELLRSEIARTGTGPQAALRGMSGSKPEGLTAPMIVNWADGQTKTARRDHWDWVLALYGNHTAGAGMVPFTSKMQSALKAEIRRSQTPPAKLFRSLKGRVPTGLQAHTVLQWSYRPPQNVCEAHFTWVMSQYQALPDKPSRIRLTADMLDRLVAEAKRTAASGHSLLLYAEEAIPDGLTPVVINRWLAGLTSTARSDHWGFVLAVYVAMPDANEGAQHVKLAERVPLTEEFLESLRVWRQACLLPSHILRSPNVPPGLKSSVVSNWMNGVSATALPDHIAYVTARCKAALSDTRFRVPLDKAARADIRMRWHRLSDTEKAELGAEDRENIEMLLSDALFTVHPAQLLDIRNKI